MSERDPVISLDRLRSSSIVSPSYGVVPLDFLVRGDLHDCPYLAGRMACEEAFRAGYFPPELYHDFMDHGFRRSGHFFYRPVCPDCRECRSIRVVVSEYRLKKSHRRVLNKNRDIEIRVGLPRFSKEKHGIYSRYLAAQHDSRQSDSAGDMKRFLYGSPVATLEFEYRLRGRIVAVGIVDLCSRSLSTVYAYYDPEFASRSLGTFSAIREILFCRKHNIPHYYLGYYIRDCPSMNYKIRFQPCEILDTSCEWVRI
jgi:arginine-tRNA-protein transferase